MPVLLPVALDQTYDYLLPDGLEARPGGFVLVPFGPQQRIGIVWDAPIGESGKPVPDKKLKAITATLADVPPLPALSMTADPPAGAASAGRREWRRLTRPQG